MIIFTAKVPRGKWTWGVAGASLLCCAALVFGMTRSPLETVASHGNPDPQKIKTDQQRLDYLQEWGWTVSPEPLAVQELLIPDPLTESYDEYVALQLSQQFPNLADYAGKRVKRYTYLITNYPTGEENIQLSLLQYNNTVIAGEVISPEANGFLHGLAVPDPIEPTSHLPIV
ncbi:MAG: DUF4830 domain-containing protein [Eubacteriales bacterium]